MTYRELYEFGVKKLQEQRIEEAKLDARLLLEYICHTDRNALLVYGERQLEEASVYAYKCAIERRAQHVPLQHITGEQAFMGLTFKVNEHTLIPRQDTEILVEEALKYLRPGMNILDMCTGSGCILLSLLHYGKGCSGTGADISKEALAVACENGQRLGVEAEWIESDLFEKVSGNFDMIGSNPPYIATKEIATLMPEVKEHEPMQALDGYEDGLFFYRKIIQKASEHLKKDACIFFEIGYDQGSAVSSILEEYGFQKVRIIKDYAGLDRVVSGIRIER